MTSVGLRLLKSSALLLIARVIHRSLGLISTLVLARLLTPSDFGSVALISLAILFFQTISSAGSEQYIIQKEAVNDEDLNTAWTLNSIFKSTVVVIIYFAAPAITNYFDSQELSSALRFSSLTLLITCTANPGVYLLKKELQYVKITYLTISQKAFSFAIMMLMAIVAPSYWVFIVGGIVSSIVWTAGSYYVHGFRPRLNLSKASEQMLFSQWMIYRSLFGFVRSQVDMLLISKSFSLPEVGKFHLARSLTLMPIQDVIGPAATPLVAGFSKFSQDRAELGTNFRISVGFIVFLVAPLCVYIAVFPHLIVDALFGEKWLDTYTLLSYMTPLIFVLALGMVLENICVALGLVKQLFFYNLVSTIFLWAALYMLLTNDLEQFVLIRSLLGLAILLCFILYLNKFIDIRFSRLIFICAPMFPIAIVGTVLVSSLDAWLHQSWVRNTPFVLLVLASSVYFLWYLVGMALVYLVAMKRTLEYRRTVRLFYSALETIIRSRRS